MNKEETKENKITEEFEEDSIENLDEKPVEPLEEGEDKKVTEDLIKEIEVKETKENWRKIREREREEAALKSWIPKTELGKEVKAGKIKEKKKIKLI